VLETWGSRMAGGGRGFAALLVGLAVCVAGAAVASAQAPDRDIAVAMRAEKRVALVIGNGAYQASPLRNPVNDSRAMVRTLRALGFEVAALENATQRDMRLAVIRFGDALRGGGAGLFFFAGPPPEDAKDPSPDGEALASAQETAAWLERAIQALPLPQREVLILTAVEGLPLNDVASILEIPLNTVKTHLRRARLRLMESYERRTRVTS